MPGFGAIPSPPDDRDMTITTPILDRLAGAVAIPSAYRLKNRPPITDQGNTPQCVAYSTAYDQSFADRPDFGRFIDFNEGLFFVRIGGTANGAVARNAMEELLNRGYPEADNTPNEARHQCASYFRVEQTKQAVQRAIMQGGGVLAVGLWWDSWSSPVGARAILPPAYGNNNGHQWWVVGWTEDGYVVCQQTWGRQWGDDGLFLMTWAQLLQTVWEIWKTADEDTTSTIVKARINAIDTTIRTTKVLGDHGTLEGSRWGETRKAGIYSWQAGKIVATPWNKWFRFKGMAAGVRHGIQPYPSSWARIMINGVERCVARPLVTRAVF